MLSYTRVPAPRLLMSPKLMSTGLLLPLGLAGCNGAFWGNLAVLGIALGIFFGTLSLGRAGATASRSAERSASSSANRP